MRLACKLPRGHVIRGYLCGEWSARRAIVNSRGLVFYRGGGGWKEMSKDREAVFARLPGSVSRAFGLDWVAGP